MGRLEGWLRKKGSHVNLWHYRYFYIKDNEIMYFVKPEDVEPRGSYVLTPGCTVGPVRESPSFVETKKLYSFRIYWPHEDTEIERSPAEMEAMELEDDDETDIASESDAAPVALKISRNSSLGSSQASIPSPPSTTPSANKRKQNVKNGKTAAAVAVAGVAVGVATLGAGLVAGAAIAAAGAGGAALYRSGKRSTDVVALAGGSHEEAMMWKTAVEDAIDRTCMFGAMEQEARRRASQRLLGEGQGRPRLPRLRSQSLSLAGDDVPTELQPLLERTAIWKGTTWQVVQGSCGLRVMEEALRAPSDDPLITPVRMGAVLLGTAAASEQPPPPVLRASTVVGASPEQVFRTLDIDSDSMRDGAVDHIQRLERLGDHCDVVHVSLRPQWVHATWSWPRDLCLLRYWRANSDGSFAVYYVSTAHRSCPPVPGFVRAHLNAGVFFVTPHMDGRGDELSMLTFVSQIDPRGWIWNAGGFRDAFCMAFTTLALDVRDAVDRSQFLPIPIVSTGGETTKGAAVEQAECEAGAVAAAAGEEEDGGEEEEEMASFDIEDSDLQCLPTQFWAEPDTNRFMVRGGNYMVDKIKVPAGDPLFNLACVDLLELPTPCSDVSGSKHSNTHRIAALLRERRLNREMKRKKKGGSAGGADDFGKEEKEDDTETDREAETERATPKDKDGEKGKDDENKVDKATTKKKWGVKKRSGFGRKSGAGIDEKELRTAAKAREMAEQLMQTEEDGKAEGGVEGKTDAASVAGAAEGNGGEVDSDKTGGQDAAAAMAADYEDFVFVVNLMIPGPPYYCAVLYFVVDKSKLPLLCDPTCPVAELYHKFFHGEPDTDDYEFRKNRFKLIPHLKEAPQAVQWCVPADKPALIGTKLKQTYKRRRGRSPEEGLSNHFELTIDIASSMVAGRIVAVTKSYAKNLVVDLGMVVQGEKEGELPEKVMAAVRLTNLDFGVATKVDEE